MVTIIIIANYQVFMNQIQIFYDDKKIKKSRKFNQHLYSSDHYHYQTLMSCNNYY